ncbi:MAG: hypothetical protein H6970_13895 [Gammaproteobacteria bacterium]|nr:hypothetical protein [Gammaproteobacteria bacterium]MCP5426141.1 hypothetical protein [Gammaproteobacteria bacterium]
MKTIAAALFAVSAGLSLNGAAFADSFNDRGIDYTDAAQAHSDPVHSPLIAAMPEFNNRGVDYIADAPAGSAAEEPMISLQDARAHSWNM